MIIKCDKNYSHQIMRQNENKISKEGINRSVMMAVLNNSKSKIKLTKFHNFSQQKYKYIIRPFNFVNCQNEMFGLKKTFDLHEEYQNVFLLSQIKKSQLKVQKA